MNPDDTPPDTSAPQVPAALDHGSTPAADNGTGTTAPLVQNCMMRGLFLLAVLAAGCVVFFAVIVFFIMPSTTHRLGAYPKLRASWNQQHIAHFPQEIPADATLKKFSHFPGYLQGGAHIQLRLQLPPARIQALHDEFASQCTTSFWGGSKYIHVSEHDGMPTTNFFTRGSSPLEFPSDYELMVFDRVLPKSERMPYMWNHGSSHGVAISVQRHEIVYWAETW